MTYDKLHNESVLHEPVRGSAMTQEFVDHTVASRMHWASRFASAIAHDLGNVILYSNAQELDQPTMSDELRTCLEQKAELAAHLKDFVAVMHVWRNHETHAPVSCSVRQWWSMHGCLLRQFVTPPKRIVLAKAWDDLMLDAVRASRITAAVLTAMELQLDAVDRFVVNVERAAAGNAVVLSFTVEPVSAVPRHVMLPGLARTLCDSVAAAESYPLPLRLPMRLIPRDE